MQAQKFHKALGKAMLGYTNKQISTAQMIAQLLVARFSESVTS